LHEKIAGGHRVDFSPGANFRMSEFHRRSAGWLQLRKLDTIVHDVRTSARRVYRGHPGSAQLVPRAALPDAAGELGSGIFLGFKSKELRDQLHRGHEGGERARGASGRVGAPAYSDAHRKEANPCTRPGLRLLRTRRTIVCTAPPAAHARSTFSNRFAGVPMDPKYTAVRPAT
jgi:hypothetical protein